VSFAVRIGKALDKYVWDRMRDRRASQVTSGVPGTFQALNGRKYALVVTFKRNGEAVPTATWFGLGDDGNVYTHTFADSWKVKRIGRDSRALVAPCDARGKPRGPAIEARPCAPEGGVGARRARDRGQLRPWPQALYGASTGAPGRDDLPGDRAGSRVGVAREG
jgi:PPOX class probable F420-dependent enzyme